MKKQRYSPCSTTLYSDYYNLTCTYYVFSYTLAGLKPQRCRRDRRQVSLRKEKDRLGIDGDTRRLVCGGSLTQVSPA